MDILSLLLIAVGLSFDTFAVSVSTGLIKNNIRFWQGVRFALTMAVLQTLMPLAGWFAGSQVADLISNYDHWVAFGLLTILGLKMILESFKKEKEKEKSGINPLKFTVMLGIAVATSIDALVVGVSFALINMNIYISIAVIGAVTFLVSMIGMLFGKKAGGRFGKRMEILGGIILIGIGLKILLSHIL